MGLSLSSAGEGGGGERDKNVTEMSERKKMRKGGKRGVARWKGEGSRAESFVVRIFTFP